MFGDKENYINYPLVQVDVQFSKERAEMIKESLKIGQYAQLKNDVPLEVYAQVPQDFNVDVKVNGNIQGSNPKDTKLIGKICHLETTGQLSSIKTRRLRNDECTIKTVDGEVRIGSYIETGVLELETQDGNIIVGKKLGIVKKGKVSSRGGEIKLSSVFSQMAHLPEPVYNTMSSESQINDYKSLS